MSTPQEQYHARVFDMLERVHTTQRPEILRAAEIVGRTVQAGGYVHTFGSGHSGAIAKEAHGRAGSLAPVNIIVDPCEGVTEQIEGYGARLMQTYQYGPPDCLIVISNSGRNALPVEVALAGKAATLPVIAITALDYTQEVTSRHSSGRRLFEIADVVLDNAGQLGDACVVLAGTPLAVGPTSTITGAFIMNCVMVEAVQWLVAAGIDPPIFRSANLDGSAEHNAALRSKYLSRRKLW